ncbi:hypothetical protein FRB93_000041 [Tulasnella sp. JGI-2019a]|nr:hypothetical protein FRB93_000041 [Tulasnella sp. JGI-2019a]
MPYLAADHQHEVSVSDYGVSGEIHATDLSFRSTGRDRRRQDGDGTPDVCDKEVPYEDTPLLVGATLPEHNLFILILAAALLPLLLCRLLFSILTAAFSLLHLFAWQKKGQQGSDTSLNHSTSLGTIAMNLQNDSGENSSDMANSDLAENAELSLQEALRAGQDTFDQFSASQREEDLVCSITSWQNALALCPMGHEIRASILKNLGKLLRSRFDRSGDMGDLEESIRHQQAAISLWPIDHPVRPSSLSQLGNALRTRFNQRGDMADLDESICRYQEALSLYPQGHADRPDCLNNLSCVLGVRFDRNGDKVDLEESARLCQEVLSLLTMSREDESGRPNNLNQILPLKKSSDQGTDPTAEAKVQGSSGEAVSSGPTTGTKATAQWSTANENATRKQPSSGPNTRNEAKSNPFVSGTLGTQWRAWGAYEDSAERFKVSEGDMDIDAIRAVALNNLGNQLGTRFENTRNRVHLEESIRHHQEALSLCPIGSPFRALILHNLGNRLDTRFKQMRNVADLEESVRHHQEALTLHPIGHPNRPTMLNNLGNRLNTRFEQMKNMADLEESVRHHQEAVTLCPIGHPDRAMALTNLGNRLGTRFEQMGNMADLTESIRRHQEVVTLCPTGHPRRWLILNNLAKQLNTQFGRTENMADLEESICHQREALSLHPTGHPNYATMLNNLGKGLITRFEQTGDVADLEESIRHHQEALAMCPIGHPGRASTLTDLGTQLNRRFWQAGNMADLEESIRYQQEALTLRPIGHPDRTSTLNNLGIALSRRFGRTGNIADLEESIQYHMDAANQVLSSLSDRMAGATNWIRTAREHSLASLEDAYSTYMNLLDRSLLLAASSIPDTHTYMVHIRKGGVRAVEDATAYAITKHRLSEAVEISERGRALLFTQLGNYRIPLKDLEDLNKGLADRFRALSTALHRTATSIPDPMTTLPDSGDQVGRRQQMAADWDHTVKEIRQLDGFENFLGVTPFGQLQKAASDGPVILVNISRDNSYALIIPASGVPLSVPLHEATPSAMGALVITLIECTKDDADGPRSNQRLMEMLRDLWAKVVAPIVLQLETTLRLPAGSRIWWMPTSFAWWLPLHAAGPYKSGERNLPDRFISSYTTTLSSLIRSRNGYQPVKLVSGPRVVVIAQAKAEGQYPLPNVDAEVALIRQLPTTVTVVEGENCTRDVVIAGLKDAAWAHFSCHGHQHPTKPFESHFSLRTADAPLTLLDIIQHDLPGAELAVLSACHSASCAPSSMNEPITITAGILFAGFRSAVGTMWAMADEDGLVMAEHFYKHMFRNGPAAVDCRDAAKAVVMGVRELRRREVPLARWINFVHYGI